MEQNLNTDHKDFFSEVIANPTEVGAMHAPQLKSLVDLYPQSGILRAMLARASQVYDQSGFQQKLKSAAVYAPDRAVLYNLINYPEKLVKYVEPFNEIVEGEEEVSLFEDDYSNYQHDDQGTAYDEEQVYESEPINYFHESEEEFQHTAEDRTNFNPVAEPEVNQPQEEYIAYNFPPAEPEAVEPQEEYIAYNFPPVEPEAAQPQEEYSAYNFPPVEPEAVQPEEEYIAYNIPPVEPEIVQPVVSDYDYTPPYREEEEEELKAPPGYTYDKPSESIEPVVPPIPDYDTPLTYQEQIARAATEAGDEVYDEIADVEDIDVEPIIKPKSNVPDITDIEEEGIEVEEENDGGEDVIAAQYEQHLPASDVAEKPKLTKAEQELADFLAQGPEYINTVPSYTAEKPQQTYTEPELVVARSEEYDYSTNDEDDADNEISESDEIAFEMVGQPVAEPIELVVPRPTPRPLQQSAAINTVPVEPQFVLDDDDARVSKYNDDKMPYSFLWWLDKVRKEHADTHQPYVPFKPIISEVQRPANDELQQQYFENIFHITSVEQLDMNTRDKRKESEIVDRFIQKDPQLKPPNTEKLDNENKAKKSAEDKNELVSETLARIYLDQMLYTKAISTYQKLMLKFPEKSSYFVAQIKILEKKIN